MLIFFCGKVTLLNFVRYIFYKYRFSFGKHQIDFNSPWKRKLHCIETAVKFAFYVGNVLLAIFVNSSWRETGPEKRYWLKGGIFFALVKVLKWSFVLQIFFFSLSREPEWNALSWTEFSFYLGAYESAARTFMYGCCVVF